MKLTLRIGVFSLAVLVALGAIAWFWLLHTSSGAWFVWSQTKERVDGELTAAQFEGDLSSGVSIRELRLSNESMQFLAEQLNVSIDLDLVPLSLTIESAIVSGVNVHLESEERDTNTPEIQWGQLLAAIRLPVKLEIEEMHVEDFRYSAGEDGRTQTITNISLQGSLKDHLVVNQLLVDTPLGSLSADLSLELFATHAMQLNATASVIDSRPEGVGDIDVTTTIEGDSDIVELEMNSQQLQLHAAGTIADVLNDPAFDLIIRSTGTIRPLQLEESTLDITELAARLTGTSSAITIDADAKLQATNLGVIDVTMEGSGTQQQFLIDEVRLRSDRIAATASGSFEWGPSPAASVTGVIDRFDPFEMIGPWPAGYPANGEFKFDWQDQKIQLHQMELAIEAAGTEISGVGEIDILEGIVSGSVRWGGVRWPLNADVAAVTSSDGELVVAGKPADWNVDGRFALQPANLPAGSVVVQGSGDLESVAVNVTDSQVFGGSIGGRIDFNWRNDKPYSADLDFSDVRVDWLWPDWPGDVAGSLELNGSLEPRSVDVNVSEMNGTLRQQSVRGVGGLSIAAGNVEFRQLNVEHGASAVSLDGNIYSSSGVDFEFVLEDVQAYIENAAGSARGNGNLSLDVDNPRIQVDATAEDVTYAEIHVDSISAVDESTNGDNPIDQRVTVSGLQFGDNVIDELEVSVTGGLVDHDLTIELIAEYGTIALSASGGLTDLQDTKLSAWQGTLAAFDIDIPDTLWASLDQPSSLQVSPGEARLEAACLSSANGEQLCVGLTWTARGGAEGNVSLTDISMDIPMAMASSDIELTQKVSGDIRLGPNTGGLLNGIASLEISPGQVRSRRDTAVSTDTDAGGMGFEIEGGNLGAGYFDLPIPGLGVVDIDFSIDELGRGADSALSGRALIDLTDIGVLANFLPYVDGTSGRLKTNIAVTGTVSDPIVTGELTMSDVAIGNSRIGTAFTEINIESKMHENSRLDLNGTFRAGNGVGAIKSSITYDDIATRGLEFEISGSDLTLIEMPDLSIVANPDLQVGLSNGELQIGGVLEIPEAMIRPGFNEGLRISESEDVVIVAGELQGQQPDADAGQGLKINGDLRVVLGSNVQVDLGVAEAKLAGSVDFEWQDDPMPIASGTSTIDGTIAAVGQVLNISQGTIRFSSVPANNPYLNIRAEREIFGNSQIRTAGVMLSGNAENPVMEAYTRPSTNEERALALLATGSDFDYEEGVGAIDFGTYIAPKLFLSYGIGVFDQENVISARYDLKKGFGIKATSGKRESGLDVNYRFEN